MSLIDELKWRGLLHDLMPGTEALLEEGPVKAYVGFDPTADSLHIGNLVPIMLLVHWQRAGHVPVALVGGATGMVGDPRAPKQPNANCSTSTPLPTTSLVKRLNWSGSLTSKEAMLQWW